MSNHQFNQINLVNQVNHVIYNHVNLLPKIVKVSPSSRDDNRTKSKESSNAGTKQRVQFSEKVQVILNVGQQRQGQQQQGQQQQRQQQHGHQQQRQHQQVSQQQVNPSQLNQQQGQQQQVQQQGQQQGNQSNQSRTIAPSSQPSGATTTTISTDSTGDQGIPIVNASGPDASNCEIIRRSVNGRNLYINTNSTLQDYWRASVIRRL